MKDTHIILAFDIGTQSTRALLISSEGEIIAKAQKGHHPAYISKQSGWAEQDPDFYYKNMCRVSKQLKESFPEEFAKAEAVTLTTIRCTKCVSGTRWETSSTGHSVAGPKKGKRTSEAESMCCSRNQSGRNDTNSSDAVSEIPLQLDS